MSLCEFCYRPKGAPGVLLSEWRHIATADICPECVLRFAQSGISVEDAQTGMFSYGLDPRGQAAPSPVPAAGAPNREMAVALATAKGACLVLVDSLVNEFLFAENQQASPQMRANLSAHFLKDAEQKAAEEVQKYMQHPAVKEVLKDPALDLYEKTLVTPETLQELNNWGQRAR